MTKSIALTLAICTVFLQYGYNSLFALSSFGTAFCLYLFFKTSCITRSTLNWFLIAWLTFSAGYFYSTFLYDYLNPFLDQYSNLSKVAMYLIATLILIISLFPSKPANASFLNRLAIYTALISLITLFILHVLSESYLLPAFNPQSLLLQNTQLLDNYSDASTIEMHILQFDRYRNDLFYGEVSFLSLIVFASCAALILNVDTRHDIYPVSSALSHPKHILNTIRLAILLSFYLLFSSQSLSGYIYMLILFCFSHKFLFAGSPRVLKPLTVLLLVILFGVFKQSYLLSRLNLLDSISFAQRFLVFQDLPLIKMLFDIGSNIEIAGDTGFHNGFAVVLLLASLGAFPYIYSVFSGFCQNTTLPSKRLLIILVLTAIFAQNGAIFSPYKLFILLLFRFSLTPISISLSPRYQP